MNTLRIAAIFLAGGKGIRFGKGIPKVFRHLATQPLAIHSFTVLASIEEIQELVVVSPEEYRSLFTAMPLSEKKVLRFATPGDRRQDSVYNGLCTLSDDIQAVITHDAARPFIDKEMVHRLLQKGRSEGAATLATPLSFTIRECDANGKGVCAPDRERYWEIQTPQYVRRDWLEKGLTHARKEKILLTDDVGAAECLGHRAHVVQGNERNRKITTPEDWSYAEFLLREKV